MSKEKETTEVKPTCGIIMPISSIDNCTSEHWNDVLGILKDVCDANGFESNLVSEALDVGIIQNRIVENIYSSDIVICDVSCKNANVMFELGMRLAFDKPTIIIKDDITGYSFDTSVIEHVDYPRDLRFTLINNFKESLGKKLVATYKKSKEGNYSSFLKNFGRYKIAHLEDKEISSADYIIKAIEELKQDINSIKGNTILESKWFNLKSGTIDHSKNELDRGLVFNTVKKYAQEYMKNNNIYGSPKEMDAYIPEIVENLWKLSIIKMASNSSKVLLEDMVRSIVYLNM